MKYYSLKKLCVVGLLALALTSLIVYRQQEIPALNIFFGHRHLNFSQEDFFTSWVKVKTSAGQLLEATEKEDEETLDLNTFLMQQNWSLNLELSWEKAVHALWMGNVSSTLLVPELQKVKKDFTSSNLYNVTLTGHQRQKRGRKKLLCQLKQQAPLRTLSGLEEPFARLGWRRWVPRKPLERLAGVPYRTCAVVTSAGSILKSSLGEEIDSHDAVLRFNAAPTQGFESDVGNKTTIRLINSQILADKQHKFTTSPLYQNVTLVAWDPGPYSGDLEKWYKKPDFDLFTPYIKHRKNLALQPFYILHPDFLWDLWKVIQSNTDEDIQPNPPSSGFTGIILMLSLCEQVDVYEFIPSHRHNSQCHYYDKSENLACTLGAYHPLLFEKLLIRRMSRVCLDDLVRRGKVTLSGFSQNYCLLKT